ncbi:Protein of unknown function (DUF2911) [Algoriphagus ratkowskyi]|uniref:DUF2911 domain-containing protein n=1 Tax=Algoriphagus ratkowskyi TaxID=57028 RepID=A0A2W7RR70_9BACT|nr:DUF2911 domain-containing protein [Algoriphagus ratkowskyi]PZX61050.1 Protein of unknown function (DUF2911) [Algoriphagus ratkowskyi]TXD79186.1 DUF2911 domain-containing protein [Algoriphagus ratkowskyi]
MKQKIAFTLAFLMCSLLSFAQQIQMPQASPSAKIAQKVGLTDVTVDYSRPSTKDRKIFGELVPYGQVWRTGANGATVLSFSTDVIIDGKSIPAGQYALYAIPGKSEWTMILSKNIKLWGAIGYQQADDVIRFKTTPEKLKKKNETFEISFANMTDTGSDLSLEWENTKVDFRIETQVDPLVMAQIKELIIDGNSTDPSLLYSAASYYYTNKKDMNLAYNWINESVEKDSKYWTMHLKAKIEAALGKKTDAVETAKVSINLAEEAGNQDYVGLNERLIKSLK